MQMVIIFKFFQLIHFSLLVHNEVLHHSKNNIIAVFFFLIIILFSSFLGSFSFYLPYVPDGGKISEDVDKQYKLHTICRTKLSFPSFTRFTKVTSEENSIIEPIDSAIDLMKSRVE